MDAGPRRPSLVDVVTGPMGFLAARRPTVDRRSGPPPRDQNGIASRARPSSDPARSSGSSRQTWGISSWASSLLHGEGILWHSTDGASWDRVPSHEAFNGAHFEDGAAIGGRLVVVGWDDNAPDKAWTSVDGLSWEGAGDVFGVENGTITNAIVTKGTLLVTGLD